MEKKLWINAEVVELGVESTEANECSVNFEVSTTTEYPGFLAGCIWNDRYEPGFFGRCKNYDKTAPGKCKLNKPDQIS